MARELLCVATRLEVSSGGVTADQISAVADTWALEQQQRGRAKTDKWSRLLFVSVATDWCRFLGYLHEERSAEKPKAFANELVHFGDWMVSERGLSPITVVHYSWYIKDILRWCEARGWQLNEISPNHIDQYLSERSTTGWSRVSTAHAAKALRVFFRHASREGWCQASIAETIQGPRIYRQEGLPSGPAWQDVLHLIENVNTDDVRDIRDRAIILLCAMYGLRSAEVRQLRLDDIDWDNSKISIWRPKLQRRQEYPLTPTVGQSIIKYLSVGRPKSCRREVFLSLRAPFRPISGGAIYRAIRNRYVALGIVSRRRGPHSLRHACATHLVEQGLSFKEVGDHLGHRSSSATQILCKGRFTFSSSGSGSEHERCHMKLTELVDHYLQFKQDLGMRFGAEGRHLRAFAKALGDVDIAEVDRQHVLRYLNGKGPLTAFWHRKFEVLTGFYRFAIGRNFVAHNPLPTMIPKRPQPFVPYIYTPDEIHALLAGVTKACSHQRCPIDAGTFRALLLLLWGTGMRLSEALHIAVADVESLSSSLLTIRDTKFFKTRLVPI